MFIEYKTQNGALYAYLTKSVRKKVDGKDKVTKERTTLGRVLDKDNGIFRSKERGVFTYDLETNTFSTPPANYVPPKNVRKNRRHEKLILDFGDVYLLNKFLENHPFTKAVDNIGYGNPDTLWTLIYFYLVAGLANIHAKSWYEGSYIKLLFPNADLESQRISDCLKTIGDEYCYREFFKEYLKWIQPDVQDGDNILIDSTGLPNDIHFPLTEISNHNGHIENEIRLIYVTQMKSGLPIYFRYVPGNVIDVSTLKTTIAELKKQGVNTKFSILDAGYCTLDNIRTLYDSGISFLMRLKPNLKVYKDVFEEESANLVSEENSVIHKDRLVYIKRVEREIVPGKTSYIYLGLDVNQKGMETKAAGSKAKDRKYEASDMHKIYVSKGYFALVSSRKISKEKVLESYYQRDKIEKIFHISKEYGNLLPINKENESTLRGHLLLTFIVSVIVKLLSDQLKDKKIDLTSCLLEMRNQKAKVFEDCVITTEPKKRMNDIYKALKIKPEVEIPIQEM